jgi:hypothetical protein
MPPCLPGTTRALAPRSVAYVAAILQQGVPRRDPLAGGPPQPHRRRKPASTVRSPGDRDERAHEAERAGVEVHVCPAQVEHLVPRRMPVFVSSHQQPRRRSSSTESRKVRTWAPDQVCNLGHTYATLALKAGIHPRGRAGAPGARQRLHHAGHVLARRPRHAGGRRAPRRGPHHRPAAHCSLKVR